ncbi:hypothetical protein MKY87_02155 [Paenibacillus sp. FSL R7-0198]|uniref:hypothetical protein n=1 Tax=Paenibacillus sp. FSL R7-0198 TaxID=2921674 RepID=UPI0030F8D16A
MDKKINFIWRKEWIFQYESPWSVFEKFAFANYVDRNDILRTLGTDEVKAIKNPGDFRRELFELHGFDSSSLYKALGCNFKESNSDLVHCLTITFSQISVPNAIWFHKDVHWCDKCIKEGYHSWFHQFKPLHTCVFHKLPLIKKCPSCLKTIPFILSNKQLDFAFNCICGFCISSFPPAGWNMWKGPKKLDKSLLEWIENNKDQTQSCCSWITHPEYSNLFVMIDGAPEAIYHLSCNNTTDKEKISYSSKYDIFEEVCSNAFQKFEFDLLDGILLDHVDCIEQLAELKKSSMSSEFPMICPYAYAYVFFKKSISRKETFYNDIFNGKYSFPELIRKELIFFSNQISKKQSKKPYSVNQDLLNWILEKIVLQFCKKFFRNWLEKAGKLSEEICVPTWSEIEEMKMQCFPDFAFKFIEDIENNLRCVESYCSILKTEYISYECDNDTNREEMRLYNSFTPQRMALIVMDEPTLKNMQLKKSVESYVKKLSF